MAEKTLAAVISSFIIIVYIYQGQNTTHRRSAIDARTTRHPGYAVSGRVRKRIEEVFGWTKATADFRKTRHRGLACANWMFTFTITAYNLVRLPRLMAAVA